VKTTSFILTLARSYLNKMQTSKIIYLAGGSVQPMRGESINAFLAGTVDAVHDENYLTAVAQGPGIGTSG